MDFDDISLIGIYCQVPYHHEPVLFGLLSQELRTTKSIRIFMYQRKPYLAGPIALCAYMYTYIWKIKFALPPDQAESVNQSEWPSIYASNKHKHQNSIASTACVVFCVVLCVSSHIHMYNHMIVSKSRTIGLLSMFNIVNAGNQYQNISAFILWKVVFVLVHTCRCTIKGRNMCYTAFLPTFVSRIWWPLWFKRFRLTIERCECARCLLLHSSQLQFSTNYKYVSIVGKPKAYNYTYIRRNAHF